MLLCYPQTPAVCIDYGTNVHIHPSSFIDLGCYIADSPDCTIVVGENTLIGIEARILGVTHPIDWRQRQGRRGPSLAGDIKIGNDCFIGAGVTVLPNVSIGDGCVIGAGSVVSKSVPAYHLAVGVPARVLRKVASDVPDVTSPGDEIKDGAVVVRELEQSDCQCRQKIESSKEGRMFEKVQPWEWLDAMKTMVSLWHGRSRHIAVDTCVVIVAAGFGYWLKG